MIRFLIMFGIMIMMVASNIVDVIIKNIRKKLDDGTDKTIIYTKRGLGYFVK